MQVIGHFISIGTRDSPAKEATVDLLKLSERWDSRFRMIRRNVLPERGNEAIQTITKTW
jgi:hypothetical protein